MRARGLLLLLQAPRADHRHACGGGLRSVFYCIYLMCEGWCVTVEGHYFNVLGKDNEDAKGQAGTSRFSRRGLQGANGARAPAAGGWRCAPTCARAHVRVAKPSRGSLNVFREVVKRKKTNAFLLLCLIVAALCIYHVETCV